MRTPATLEQLSLTDLQPSQFYVSAEKLQAVEAWFRPEGLSGFAPIPVRWLDGAPVMTDGHTRAVAALRAGLTKVPLAWEEEELDWEMYRRCAAACRARGVSSPADLRKRVVSAWEYREKWDSWCEEMQAEVERERKRWTERAKRGT